MNSLYFVFLYFLLLMLIQYHGYILFLITGDYFDRYSVKRKFRKNRQSIDALLNDRFLYYRHLSPPARNRFTARLCKVMGKVAFTGHAGLEVTEEMKICVIFAQIQLTFGMKLFFFERFRRYILYPESFYSRFFNSDLKGLTSGAGFITLSWADFQEGYLVHNDNYNLGLHEMAHALRLELETTRETGLMVQLRSDEMDRRFPEEKELAARGVPGLLREYAYVNDEEFFSVCVEYFFEVPELLKQHKPEIYGLLSRMLNQDPLNRERDYRLSVTA
ncbi:zinc-dependent peptidase [Lentimicrobium sp.]|uniref:zinc-dependent peptidase n=1 Tax=Lentimicrobium sp. TaxID=2034841 RepID=UPI00345EE195